MHEDEAILYLLDLGTGTGRRSREVTEKVEEVQRSCGLREGDEKQLKEKVDKSDIVTIGMTPSRIFS